MQTIVVHDLCKIVTKMQHVAAKHPDDKMSNILSRTADRLAHIGLLFDGYYGGPLTKTEWRIIRKFMK